MKSQIKLFLNVALIALIASTSVKSQSKETYTKYVNTFIGTAPVTDAKILGYQVPEGWRPWSGLTFPGSSLPNAMVQLSPMTEYSSGAGYQYEDKMIYGFTHTNKGHWNLCNLPVLPMSNPVAHQISKTKGRFGSTFSHAKESAAPGFYQVYLEDYGINVSLTSTLRSGFHKYEYKDNRNRQILFDLARANNGISNWNIQQEGASSIQGFQQTGEKIYFFATLNTPIKKLEKNKEGKSDGYAIVHLADGSSGPVELKIGISFVSIKNAKENLDKEIGSKSFEDIKGEATKTWEALLSNIQVKGGTSGQKEMFYSCLYRSFLWPALRSDINGEFTDAKKNVAKADFNYYTEPSLWDTYRNKDVLLGLISPKVSLDVIKSMKDVGDKTGFIPTFFHGDHGASSITGAYLRGIDNFDVKGTYKILLRNAYVEGARPFLKEYSEKGYISDPDVANPEVETKGSAGVSKTLEYAYDDYSLAQMAKKLGDTVNYKILMARSKNYKNMFDPTTRFMRGRLQNGDWIKNFNPQYPYYEYMYREANAWQVSFFAPHDMKGLIELYGGSEGFESKLDSFFTVPWNPTYIARNIESFIGQYCHGNQPDHEAPFAYTFIGKPEKSQKILDKIMNTFYGIGADKLALCGMDDAGEMSAWYVFSALGLYPYSATDPEYIVSVPLFDEIKWKTPAGRLITINKPGKGRDLKSIKVNGDKLNGYFVQHELFKSGGTIDLETK
jgi:predicted alpha-1,2-mannosidase